MRGREKQRGNVQRAVSFWADAVEAQQANLVGTILLLQARSPAATEAYFRISAASKDPLVAPPHSDYAGFDASTERELEACLGACRAFQSALFFLGRASLPALRMQQSHLRPDGMDSAADSDQLIKAHLRRVFAGAVRSGA